MRNALIVLAAAAGFLPAAPNTVGANELVSRPPVMHLPVRHACTIRGCAKRCPRGEWRCNGKCIKKDQACRLIP